MLRRLSSTATPIKKSCRRRAATQARWRGQVRRREIVVRVTTRPCDREKLVAAGSQNRRGRLSAFRLCRLPKSQAWSTTVLVDELDASFLKGSSYDIKGRATWLAPLLFELVNGHDANARSISQVLLAPT